MIHKEKSILQIQLTFPDALVRS